MRVCVLQVTLLSGAVFASPFTDLDEKMAAALAKEADPTKAAADARAKAAEVDAQPWINNQHERPKLTVHKQGIGKYVAPQRGGGAAADAAALAAQLLAQQDAGGDDDAPEEAALAEPPKKRPKGGGGGGGFGNFAGW